MLPMAVQQDILIACGKNDSNTLNIANSDGAKFPCVLLLQYDLEFKSFVYVLVLGNSTQTSVTVK